MTKRELELLKAQARVGWKCPACDLIRGENGHDPCIANLPGVEFACCGHGYCEGYILFHGGTIIRFVLTAVEQRGRPQLNPKAWGISNMTKPKKPVKKRTIRSTEPPRDLRGKVELINAMVALRRYHDNVLLMDLSANGEVKMASAEIARALTIVLNAANRTVEDT